jgi:pyridoxamine 5'-phosphate oxidase
MGLPRAMSVPELSPAMNLDGALSAEPFAWLRDSLSRAERSETFDPTRAALATCDAAGRPSVRFVLVKLIDERGFGFFTNLTSVKARHLAAQPHAALAFHWATISEQVRVEGPVEALSGEEADAYFATRPRGSQLSAWASRQSETIEDRAALEAKRVAAERCFQGQQQLPRPPFWAGFRLVPSRIEFWRDREDRLHDRWSFTRALDGWKLDRLQP